MSEGKVMVGFELGTRETKTLNCALSTFNLKMKRLWKASFQNNQIKKFPPKRIFFSLSLFYKKKLFKRFVIKQTLSLADMLQLVPCDSKSSIQIFKMRVHSICVFSVIQLSFYPNFFYNISSCFLVYNHPLVLIFHCGFPARHFRGLR